MSDTRSDATRSGDPRGGSWPSAPSAVHQALVLPGLGALLTPVNPSLSAFSTFGALCALCVEALSLETQTAAFEREQALLERESAAIAHQSARRAHDAVAGDDER